MFKTQNLKQVLNLVIEILNLFGYWDLVLGACWHRARPESAHGVALQEVLENNDL